MKGLPIMRQHDLVCKRNTSFRQAPKGDALGDARGDNTGDIRGNATGDGKRYLPSEHGKGYL